MTIRSYVLAAAQTAHDVHVALMVKRGQFVQRRGARRHEHRALVLERAVGPQQLVRVLQTHRSHRMFVAQNMT